MTEPIWASAVAFMLLLVVAGLACWSRRGEARSRSVTSNLVRRRLELKSQLQALAGDSAPALLQAEARLRHGRPADIAVIEAAIARATRHAGGGLAAETGTRS